MSASGTYSACATFLCDRSRLSTLSFAAGSRRPIQPQIIAGAPSAKYRSVSRCSA